MATAPVSTPNPHNHEQVASDGQVVELRQRWTARYGALVATQLEPDRRYSLVRVGSAEYAFTDYDRYVRALRHLWSSRVIPEPLTHVVGWDLLHLAPNLQAVDPDPAELRGPHERGGSRFA
jgi:hypothetical protein